MAMEVPTQGQMAITILIAVMEIEAIVTTHLTVKMARKVVEAKVLATAVTMTNQTENSLAAHQGAASCAMFWKLVLALMSM